MTCTSGEFVLLSVGFDFNSLKRTRSLHREQGGKCCPAMRVTLCVTR